MISDSQATHFIYKNSNDSIIFVSNSPHNPEIQKLLLQYPNYYLSFAHNDFYLDSIKNYSSWSKQTLVSFYKKGQLLSVLAFYISKLFYQRAQNAQSAHTSKNTENRLSNFSAVLSEWIQISSNSAKLPTLETNFHTTVKTLWSITPTKEKLKLIEKGSLPFFGKESFLKEHPGFFSPDTDPYLSWALTYQSDLPTAKLVLISDRINNILAQLKKLDLSNQPIIVVCSPAMQNLIQDFLTHNTLPSSPIFRSTPKKGKLLVLLAWLLPLLILFSLLLIGVKQGQHEAFASLLFWVLATSGLSTLGALLAKSHIFTILTALLFAPLTALSPLVGIGHLTVLVQGWFSSPTLKDLDTLDEDFHKFTRWWENKALKVLLAFLLPSIGGAIGTYIASVKIFSKLF